MLRVNDDPTFIPLFAALGCRRHAPVTSYFKDFSALPLPTDVSRDVCIRSGTCCFHVRTSIHDNLFNYGSILVIVSL
ncbi:hypothetical protein BDN67DRAFT_746811 [Paxillus ammoniavirescens]|nr:hypothetical protein BDN67DRAFT_746811 [Paxillus ammoniavirescens]